MGASRSFNGTSDNVNVGSDSSLDNIHLVTGFTFVAVWVYVDNAGSGGDLIMSKGTWSAQVTKYSGGGNWRLRAQSGSFSESPTGSVQPGSWNFYCWKIANSTSGSQNRTYINAVEQSHAGANGSLISDDSANDLIINNGSFPGDLAYMHIYNRILTAGEMSNIMNHPGSILDGLVGYWPLTGGGGNEPDLSGNGNTGTVTGATEIVSGPPVIAMSGAI